MCVCEIACVCVFFFSNILFLSVTFVIISYYIMLLLCRCNVGDICLKIRFRDVYEIRSGMCRGRNGYIFGMRHIEHKRGVGVEEDIFRGEGAYLDREDIRESRGDIYRAWKGTPERDFMEKSEGGV